jgi:D-alanyl-D-alanine carboxypeptidase (penicillin-binding protein 5/6)
MKNTILAILAAVVLVCALPQVSHGAAKPPEILAETAIVIDVKTGQILYDKSMHEQREPASTTKVITALLALENLEFEQTVTIDAETPFTGGSRIYLLEDEQITVEQLMYALLLESANDAGVALAKAMAGTVPDFADMMNRKAAELGAQNTNFVNPHGLHEDGHLTTAYDLAMIARAAMENARFRDLVLTYRHEIPATNKQPERYMYNTNRLIYDEVTKVLVNGIRRPAKYEGATGIKTGYTPQAGGCLVAGAVQGDTELISVVMKSTDEGRFADSIALLDYAFENYKTVKAIDGGVLLGEISIKRGSVQRVQAVTAGEAYATLPVEASMGLITTEVQLDESVRAPVAKGQKVGFVEIYAGDMLVASVDAVTTDAIPEGGALSVIGVPDETAAVIERAFATVIIAILLLFAVYVVLKRRQIRRRKQRRLERELRYRRREEQRQYDELRR